MNGRMLTHAAALCITLALTACATAPKQEMSILDAMAAGSMSQPLSCAAMDAATLCVKATRLSKTKDCGCVGRQEIANGGLPGSF
jgi:hypothetical protein